MSNVQVSVGLRGETCVYPCFILVVADIFFDNRFNEVQGEAAEVLLFLFNPVFNGFSRSMERASDKYGMDITDISGESAAVAFDKLSVLNLSDPDPHPIIEFWFYSHPALKDRMESTRL